MAISSSSIVDAFFARSDMVGRFDTERFILKIQSKPALRDIFSPLSADRDAKEEAERSFQKFSSKMKIPKME